MATINGHIITQSALTMVGALTTLDFIKDLSMLSRPGYDPKFLLIKFLVAFVVIITILIIVSMMKKEKIKTPPKIVAGGLVASGK